MKLSDLSTDQAADVLCELAPHIESVTHDENIISEIGRVENFDNGITKPGLAIIWAGRASKLMPVILKTHRADVYGILSIINGKSVDEIASQNIKETIRQVTEALKDEDLVSFFKSSAPQGETEQSVLSADSRNSG